MTPNVNILDMLLGLSGGQQVPDANGGKPIGPVQTPFIDILGLFTQQIGADETEISNRSTNEDPFDDMTQPGQNREKLLQLSLNDVWDRVIAPIDVRVTASPAASLRELSGGSGDDVTAASFDLETDRLPKIADLPRQAGLIVVREQSALPGIATKYEIVGQRLAGDTVEFELKSHEEPSVGIQVSLPKAGLDESLRQYQYGAGQAIVADKIRVPVAAVINKQQTDGQLQKLFEDLKLKSLRIEPTPERTPRDNTTVKVDLLGSRGTEPVVISQAIHPSHIKLSRQTTRHTGGAMKSTMSVDVEDSGSQARVDGRVVATSSRLLNRSMTAFQRPRFSFDLAEKFEDRPASNFQADSRSEMSSFFETGSSSRTGLPRTEYSNIRVILPEDFNHQLAARSNSISLKIQPEHLGPARLQLHMRQDMLTARVTVDTVQAKQVVEHALDQLHQQLDRAGIRVDRIEVNVGGHAQQQFAERQADWHRSRAPRYLSELDETAETGGLSPISALESARTVPQYITNESVNLLA